MFWDAVEQRRCLVLADGFYEWKGSRASMQPFRIEQVDREPYAYAGLWETWSNNGTTKVTCTILTCDANEVVGEIHDRRPVMLKRGEEETWLGEDGPDAWRSVFDPYPDDEPRAYPVSKRVNNPKNDDVDLLEEVDIGEQSGLSDFSE